MKGASVAGARRGPSGQSEQNEKQQQLNIFGNREAPADRTGNDVRTKYDTLLRRGCLA